MTDDTYRRDCVMTLRTRVFHAAAGAPAPAGRTLCGKTLQSVMIETISTVTCASCRRTIDRWQRYGIDTGGTRERS